MLRISGITRPYFFEPMSWFWTYIAAFTACGEPVLNQYQEYRKYQGLILSLYWDFLGKFRPGFEPILWLLHQMESQFWTSAENIGNNETLFFWTYVLALNLYCSFYSMWRASFEPLTRIFRISRPCFKPMLQLSWQIEAWFWTYTVVFTACRDPVLNQCWEYRE